MCVAVSVRNITPLMDCKRLKPELCETVARDSLYFILVMRVIVCILD